jgi:hypothetical protein
VKASLTAVMVVRSLSAALGEVRLRGVVLELVVKRGDSFLLVVGSAVVSMDMRFSRRSGNVIGVEGTRVVWHALRGIAPPWSTP